MKNMNGRVRNDVSPGLETEDESQLTFVQDVDRSNGVAVSPENYAYYMIL